MRQHRDALERCKATIQLTEGMIREHEAGYRTALEQLNQASMPVLADRMANRVSGDCVQPVHRRGGAGGAYSEEANGRRGWHVRASNSRGDWRA
jgi:hypothetical protein